MLVNIKVTGGLNIESGHIDPKATQGLRANGRLFRCWKKDLGLRTTIFLKGVRKKTNPKGPPKSLLCRGKHIGHENLLESSFNPQSPFLGMQKCFWLRNLAKTNKRRENPERGISNTRHTNNFCE